jgi:nuclease S1
MALLYRVGDRRRALRILPLGLLLVFASCGSAFAWGEVGHKVVCEIAFRLALPETRAEIRRLIQTDTQFDFFSDSCTWPDHPRQRGPEHFVNLPRTTKSITTNKCPLAATCTLTAIPIDMAVLSSSSASDAKKLAALKFLGHWLGDIHQPLHVSFEDDKGGNEISVEGECSGSLHSTWDTCLVLEAVGSDVRAAATDLIQSITPGLREQWTATAPRDWANESYKVARAPATKYCVQQGGSCEPGAESVDVDASYVQTNKAVVRQQLSKAGVRLAHLLNEAFGN